MIRELNFRGESKSYEEYSNYVRDYKHHVRDDEIATDKYVAETLVITDTDGKNIGVILPYINRYQYSNGTVTYNFYLSFHPDINNLNYDWENACHSLSTEAEEGFVNHSLTYSAVRTDLVDLMYRIQSKLNRCERRNNSDSYYEAGGFTNLKVIDEWISNTTTSLQRFMKEEAF